MAGFIARSRQDPRAESAFRLAAVWGSGQAIDGVHALSHAVNVANALGRYTPDAPPQVVAACLLHAIPEWPMANEAAHELVEAQCGVEARLLLEALRAEQTILAELSDGGIEGHLRLLRTMPWLAHATLAFKIVALQYVSERAARGCDAEAAWRPFTFPSNQLPYLRQLHDLAAGVMSQTMSGAYIHLLEQRLPVTVATASR